MIRFIFQLVLLLLVTGLAFWRGDRPEKLVAAICLSMMLAVVTYPIFHDGNWSDAQYFGVHAYRFTVDTFGLAAIVFVALKFDRAWVLAAGSFQMISVSSHLIRAANLPMDALAYAVMERWPSWVILFLLGLGTWNRVRTLKAGPRANDT